VTTVFGIHRFARKGIAMISPVLVAGAILEIFASFASEVFLLLVMAVSLLCKAAIGLASSTRQRVARRGFNENLVSRWNAPSTGRTGRLSLKRDSAC
jgi:hypothetical protein